MEGTDFRRAVIKFGRGLPLEIVYSDDGALAAPTDEQWQIARRVTSAVKGYISAARDLLSGPYSAVREIVPPHLRGPARVAVVCCTEGVAIRYEGQAETAEVGGGWHQGNLALLVEAMSDSVVHCHSQRDYVSTVATNGVELHISKVDGTTGQEQTIGQARIGFDTVVECPERWPDPPHKPYCLLSVQDQFEIYMEVELVRGDSPEERRPRILVRNQARLPVGWECIEVFPGLDMDYWKPEYARSWAESDILAAVVRAQTTEAAFNSLDPTASARKQKASLLKEYKELLDSNPEREEVLQAFLKKHPELICPTHIRMRPKLALGRRVTDFVFQEAAGGYLLVELEGSSDPLFLANGDRSAELRHAQDQIVDWKRYLEDNLGTVQHELGLAGISVNPSSLIIIGRSRLLRPEDRRKLTTFHNESPTVTILTYDDVYESAKAVIENLLGPLWIVPAGSTVVYYLGTGGQTPPQH